MRGAAHNGGMPGIESADRCPCGTGLTFGDCCEPFLTAVSLAPTAERLMRSRYTAYVTGTTEYLMATWHPSTRPDTLVLDPDIRWLGLEIVRRERGGMLDTEGIVEFRATYRTDSGRAQQRETSTFRRENRAWFYVDGVVDH
jgi:SEC-C motif domain protein